MTHRQRIVLAALAPANGAMHSPVQLQKLFFLLDKQIPAPINGPLFAFVPYDYGPFDRAVYSELNLLEADGLVESVPQRTWSGFRLTERGQQEGQAILGSLSPTARDYIGRVSDFVRSLSFGALVTAIYKAYPEMKANSVFQG
jgi:hypothetical protein